MRGDVGGAVEGEDGFECRGGGVDGHGVDFVREEMDLVFLAELHEFDEGLAGIRAAEGVMRVAEEDGADFRSAGLLGGEEDAFVLRYGGGTELVGPGREGDVDRGDLGFGAEVDGEGLVDGARHEDGVAGGGEGEAEEFADGADAVGEEEVVGLDGDDRVEALVHVVGHGAAEAWGPPWPFAVGELVVVECDWMGLGELGDFGDHDVVFCSADV